MYQSNVSWAMQYGTMKKEACVNECFKINHDIPSVHFIETERLKSVKKEADLKISKAHKKVAHSAMNVFL